MPEKPEISGLLEKLQFPQTDEKFNLDYNYKIKSDCDFYNGRIALSKSGEKLSNIFAAPAIFDRYRIKEVIIVSDDEGMMVYPRDGGQPTEYQADTFYENVDFRHPALEKILENHDYSLGQEVECVGGDYFMAAEFSESLTVGQLKDILALGCVKRVEIELELSRQ